MESVTFSHVCTSHSSFHTLPKPWERALTEVQISEVVAQGLGAQMAVLKLEPRLRLLPLYKLDVDPVVAFGMTPLVF